MNYLKDLFVKGRFHLYIGFTVLIESQRRYLLPQSTLYKNVKQTVIYELQLASQNQDTSSYSIETASPQQLKKLKVVTKRKFEEVQRMHSDRLETLPISCSILAMGGINYFLSPTICAIFVGGYLTLLTVDFLKSIAVLKFGWEPVWHWKMKDMGYVTACGFAAVTATVITKRGISKLKERTSKALALRRAEGTSTKKE